MELYSLAHAPGLSILSFDLKTESNINVFSSSVGWGKNSIFRFKYSFNRKLHSSPGNIVKKTEGGHKLYHIENNLVLASFAASSLYGMFLHAALTVFINLLDELEIPELMSNLIFLDN
jgi:hypothetical protein